MIALASVANADDDIRPRKVALVAPPGDFTPPSLPAGVNPEPPVEGWWKKRGACPKDTKLDHQKVKDHGRTWVSYTCKGTGTPKPYTAWNDGNDYEAWWTDVNGERHGGVLIRSLAYVTTEMYIHGKRAGRWTHRALEGKQSSFTHYREDKKHGLAHDATASMTVGGYYVDGKREGTWFAWNTDGTDGIVRAVFQYKGGVMEGTQRWWTRDGKLLARGELVAGAGTWLSFGPDGARAETRCNGRDVVEASARDRAGTLLFRSCGAGAASCTPHGTKDGGERQSFGEVLCGSSSVPPFKLW